MARKRKRGGTARKRSRSVTVTRRRGTAPLARRRRVSRGGRGSFSIRGVIPMMTAGVKDAAVGVAAKTAVRYTRSKLGFDSTGTTGMAVELGLAAAVGLAAGRFGGASIARAAIQGALSAPLEAFVKAHAPTSVAAVLGDVGDYSDAISGVAGYPQIPAGVPQIAGYPGTEMAVGGYNSSDSY